MAEVKKPDSVISESVASDQAKLASESNPKVSEKTAKKTKPNEKKKSKVVAMLKETGSELKKVTWPTFGRVVKQTGVVLAVVIFFTAILFAFDRILSLLFGLIV